MQATRGGEREWRRTAGPRVAFFVSVVVTQLLLLVPLKAIVVGDDGGDESDDDAVLRWPRA